MFKLGTLVTTDSIDTSMQDNQPFAEFIHSCLLRYMRHDWGELPQEDEDSNNLALDPQNPARILGSYNIPTTPDFKHADRDGNTTNTKVWFITEWDRSVTTVLFPTDY